MLNYPYQAPADTIPVKPLLTMTGTELSDGNDDLLVRLEEHGKPLHEEKASIHVENGSFEKDFELPQSYPGSEAVSWVISAPGHPRRKARAALKWSHFHGRVIYLSGKPHTTTINMIPVTWGRGGAFYIPVAEDEALTPWFPHAIFGAINVSALGIASTASNAGHGITI